MRHYLLIDLGTGSTRAAIVRSDGKTLAMCSFFNRYYRDDAYPDARWLENAVKYFSDPAIGAVGGPVFSPAGMGGRDPALLPRGSRRVPGYPHRRGLRRGRAPEHRPAG